MCDNNNTEKTISYEQKVCSNFLHSKNTRVSEIIGKNAKNTNKKLLWNVGDIFTGKFGKKEHIS